MHEKHLIAPADDLVYYQAYSIVGRVDANTSGLTERLAGSLQEKPGAEKRVRVQEKPSTELEVSTQDDVIQCGYFRTRRFTEVDCIPMYVWFRSTMSQKILNIIESILEEVHENCQQVIVTQLIYVIEFILDHKQIYVIFNSDLCSVSVKVIAVLYTLRYTRL